WGYAPNPTNDDVDFDAQGNPVGGFFTKPSAFLTRYALPSSIWPMSGHDPRRTGLSPFTGPALVPRGPSWVFDAGAPIVGDLAVSSQGNIYFAAGSKLYALNPHGTNLTSPVGLPDVAATSPAIDDRNSFVYIAVGNVLAGTGFDIIRY